MPLIEVIALPDGWRVAVDQTANDMIFRSGREAERAARRLADRLARAGLASEVRLYLKDGTLGARFLSPARRRPDATPISGNDTEGRERRAQAA